MTGHELATHLRGIVEVPRDILLRRYPPFVTGGPLPDGDVPVFVFHSLEPTRFGAQLDYLAQNGYVPLSMNEYLAHLMGRQTAPRKAVLLTFDDARGSLWSVGAPLLRRYGMRGVVFVVPGRIRNRMGPPWPTIDDVTLGARLDDVLLREKRDGAFLFWEEITSLAREGIFDFGSHTLSHSRIHCSSHREGFVTPDRRLGYDSLDLPEQREGDHDLIGEAIPLGAPILHSAPRLSDSLRLYENPEARRACNEAAESQGPDFFARPGWQQTLRQIARRFPPVVGTETEEARRAAIEGEIAGAQRLIEEQSGLVVRHFCYPWHASSAVAREITIQTGHAAAFCGKVSGAPMARQGDDPFAIPRIGEDWLMTLPGKARVGALGILKLKWNRRLGGLA